ncbi:NADPH-dependent 3-demethoxyubiquinone 3-hydroxylase, mitochondrial isoform X2 [Oryzias latipes]
MSSYTLNFRPCSSARAPIALFQRLATRRRRKWSTASCAWTMLGNLVRTAFTRARWQCWAVQRSDLSSSKCGIKKRSTWQNSMKFFQRTEFVPQHCCLSGTLRGASTALLGKEGAMACTVAVEESISEHYNSQIRVLMEKDPERYTELLQVIKEFRDDEMEHHDTGLEHDAESVPGFWLLKNVIQLGCKAAISISERV